MCVVRRSWIVLGCLALMACGGGEGVSLPDQAEAATDEEAPLAVTTRAVETREVRPTIDAVGTAQPIRAADIGPQMSARIDAIEVSEGDEVEEGQVVVRLDARTTRLGASQAASAARGASAQVQQLEQELARLRPLASRGTIPSQQVEQMELQLEAARAQASAASSGAAQASAAARNGIVRAPFDGVVASVPMEVGETATMVPSSTILRIVDLSAVEIDARVPERELARLREGAGATVRFPALQRAFEGTVARIAPEIDPQTRTLEVVVRVANEDRVIRGGMSAEVAILPGGARTALVLPSEATRGMGESRRVFVAADGHAEERTVRVAPLEEGTVEVLEGLAAGDSVVAPLPSRLRDGATITVQDGGETAQAAAGEAT
ncbi:MAG TPA: efflux RND transporter periplasmic adaptor subunit [Sandaracinaceae bacterium LLY-WYZ-13_1]|nr:efflux RND transporter periplasmic adaptor subunit [Sandaracinaceae bacterium LLY-WYZ-13_1]